MNTQILFIQGGGGKEDYEVDTKLVNSLQDNLSKAYTIHYPLLTDEPSPDFGRIQQIDREVSLPGHNIILVGYSLGASMLLKYLSENEVKKEIVGIFLIATPYWSGSEDWVQPLKLQKDFSARLPKEPPLFFYHCKDDEIVPFQHLSYYEEKLSHAVFREIESGGHQLNNDLTPVAKDILALAPSNL